MAHNHQIFETQVQVLQHLHVAHMAKTGKLMSYAAFLREKCRGVATRGTKERHEMRDSAESGARQDDAASAEQEQATKPKIRALRLSELLRRLCEVLIAGAAAQQAQQ